jgi:hypothetical protein
MGWVVYGLYVLAVVAVGFLGAWWWDSRHRPKVPDRLWVQLHLVGQGDSVLLVEAELQGRNPEGLHRYVVEVDDTRLVKGVSLPVVPAYSVVEVVVRIDPQ